MIYSRNEWKKSREIVKDNQELVDFIDKSIEVRDALIAVLDKKGLKDNYDIIFDPCVGIATEPRVNFKLTYHFIDITFKFTLEHRATLCDTFYKETIELDTKEAANKICELCLKILNKELVLDL